MLSRSRELPNPNSDGQTHFRIHRKIDESNKIDKIALRLLWDSLLMIHTCYSNQQCWLPSSTTISSYILHIRHGTEKSHKSMTQEVEWPQSISALGFYSCTCKPVQRSFKSSKSHMPLITLNLVHPAFLRLGSPCLYLGKRIILGWAVLDQNQRPSNTCTTPKLQLSLYLVQALVWKLVKCVAMYTVSLWIRAVLGLRP